jgi:hypothetical protein
MLATFQGLTSWVVETIVVLPCFEIDWIPLHYYFRDFRIVFSNCIYLYVLVVYIVSPIPT